MDTSRRAAMLTDLLGVNGCDVPTFDGLIWTFPCGLKIDDELNRAVISAAEATAAHDAHARHHIEGHENRHWDIIVTRTGIGEYEATCGCRS